MQASKIRRKAAITDDGEDKAQPPKKKPKTRLQDEGGPDTATEQISLNKGPKQLNTRVFSQASEDAKDTHTNTEASDDWDDSGNEETNTDADARGRASDEEEWGFSQLDEMATQDAQVRNASYPENALTHCRIRIDSQKTQGALKHRGKHPSCRPCKHLQGW